MWGKYDYNSCIEGNGVCGICGPEGSGRLEGKCTTDADCALPNWCQGGGWINGLGSCTGRCKACPKNCGLYGCNARFNNVAKLDCGRVTESGHIKKDLESIGKAFLKFASCFKEMNEGDCISDAIDTINSCTSGKGCIIKFGGKGSNCLSIPHIGFDTASKELD